MPARILGALLACAIAAACSGRPPETAARAPASDPPAASGSTPPRLSAANDRIVLSWIEAEGGPRVSFAVRDGKPWSRPRTVTADPLLAVEPANVPGVVPLEGGGFAAHWSVNPSPSESHARTLLVATSQDGLRWSAPLSP